MGLYWPNFSLVFLIRLFLYAGVYCNEGMSNDAPIHECESEIDHYTRHYVPYSLRKVCGFFNVPQIYYMCKGL